MIVRELFARLGVKVDKSSFDAAEDAIKGVKAAVLKMGAGLLAAKVALMEMAKATADAAREAQNTAQITGLTTQQVQELGYAAARSGSDADEMRMSLVHLARSATEAAQGSSEAAAAYYRLGIRVAGADGKVRPLAELLADVSTRFSSMPDGTAKAAAAMQLFGRAGAQLIPLLNRGPAGFAALGAEARRLGIVMGDDAVRAAREYGGVLARMKASVQGLTYAIGGALFPALSRGTQALTEWVVAHRQWLALKVREAFEAVSKVLHGVVALVERGVGVLRRFWDSGSTGKAVLVALAAAVTLLVAPFMSLVSVLALVAEDFEVFLGGKGRSVIGFLVLMFKALAAEAGKVWESFKADPFGKLYEWAAAFFSWFVEQAAALPGKIGAAIGAKPIKAWSDAVTAPLDWLYRVMEHQQLQAMGASVPVPSQAPAAAMMWPGAMAGAAAGNAGFSPTINITAPGGDGPSIAGAVRAELEDFWGTKMRETGAAVNR